MAKDIDDPAMEDLGGGEIVDFDNHQRHIPDPRNKPEAIRKFVTYGLLIVLTTLSIMLVAGVFFGYISVDDAEDLSGELIQPLIVLFGTAIGCFFGGYRN